MNWLQKRRERAEGILANRTAPNEEPRQEFNR